MREEGYLCISGPDERREYATLDCPHCNRVIVVRKGTEDPGLGTFCQKCNRHVCQNPKCNAGCRPFELAMERYERKHALLRAVEDDQKRMRK